MSIGKSMEEFQKEEDEFRERQMVKMGDYSGDDCPNCGRHRVMVGDDGKRRCEKCCWCIEDDEYDTDFVRFMR